VRLYGSLVARKREEGRKHRRPDDAAVRGERIRRQFELSRFLVAVRDAVQKRR
jgi:hypothetical protein